MAEQVKGVFKRTRQGGVLRDAKYSFRPNTEPIFIPNNLVSKYKLVDGAEIAGKTTREKQGLILSTISKVCGNPPAAFAKRTEFRQLTPIAPNERFNLSLSDDPSMRAIDLVAPVGKGSRALIVSPPKAGKTMMLEKIANAIHKESPDARIITLLIDERPEEVTFFRRSVSAEVLASSSDQTAAEHVELAELTLAHIQTELECGRDVIVLVDSLTRMGRAFNLKGTGKGRTLSGGVEVGALEIPRRFFGLARNIENGGSVTIIATALIDTGSRMDEVIFEEFKGTGNCEVVLDRSLAEGYIFPAIDILKSGTRKEEQLYPEDEFQGIVKLRRMLAGQEPKEAMRTLLSLFDEYATNKELLKAIQ
jgi:transcription termination factor Rho